MPATVRFEARINTEIQSLLKRAATLEGRSLSDFVVGSEKNRGKNELIHLSIADQQYFAEALISSFAKSKNARSTSFKYIIIGGIMLPLSGSPHLIKPIYEINLIVAHVP